MGWVPGQTHVWDGRLVHASRVLLELAPCWGGWANATQRTCSFGGPLTGDLAGLVLPKVHGCMDLTLGA